MDGLCHPGFGAVGSIPAKRESDRRDFGFGHRSVDEVRPVGPTGSWPWIEDQPLGLQPKARPSPIIGSSDHAGAERVPLHVTDDGQRMLILMDRKGLEPPRRTWPLWPVVSQIPAHVGSQQPVHPPAQIAVGMGPKHGVEVVRYNESLIVPTFLRFCSRLA